MAPEKIVIDYTTDALVHVDVQPTFMPGGGLAVKDGDAVVPLCVKLQRDFVMTWATLDEHPYGHISLASSYVGLAPYAVLTPATVAAWARDGGKRLAEHAQFDLGDLGRYLRAVGSQVLWPDHAVCGTAEAQMHPALYAVGDFHRVLIKGWDPKCDSYSGFRDNLRRPTGLADEMREEGVQRVFLTGLAFDFCVGWTALDGIDEGFEVFLIEDATRSVDMPGSVAKMRADLAAKGVRVIGSSQLDIVL